MIAHVGGLPVEETLAQLAPAGATALVALGLLIERARSRVARLGKRLDSAGQRNSSTDRH